MRKLDAVPKKKGRRGAIFVLALLLAQAAGAQKLEVVLRNGTGQPVKDATVAMSDKNGKPLSASASDSLGHAFFLLAAPGTVQLLVTHINYIPYRQAFLFPGKDTVLLFTLKDNINQMANITITGQRPAVIMEPDRYIVNVDGNTTLGNSTLDILKKSPGITITNDQVLLENKPVMVQVNGRTMPLTGKDLLNYLAANSAVSLNQIELITTPPASFDAALSGGVINLKTRKLLHGGYNGNLFVTGGHRSQDPYESLDGSINYRRGKFNLFGSAGAYGGTQRSRGNVTRRFSNNNNFYLIEEENRGSTRSNGIYYNAGLDVYLNKKNIIGFQLNGSYGDVLDRLRTTSRIYKTKLDSLNILDFTTPRKSALNSINANLKKLIDSLGQELNIDVDLDFVSNDIDGHQLYTYQLPDGVKYRENTTIDQFTNSYGRLLGVKADYIKPLRKFTFESGVKFTNSYIRHRLSETRNIDALPTYINDRFTYRENIYAAYASINGKSKTLTYRVGLRTELTDLSVFSETGHSGFSRNYINLFPTASIAKSLDKKNTLTLSFRRGVTRPRFNQLNPFRYNLSPFFYYVGNPYLQPFYPNNIRLGYAYENKLQASLSYSTHNDQILEYSVPDGQSGVLKGVKDNNGNFHILSASITYSFNPAKWWFSSSTLNAARDRLYFEPAGAAVVLKNRSASFYTSQTFNFKKGWRSELYLYATSASYSGPVYYKPYWFADFSLYKDLFRKKAQFSLSVRDIFYTNVTRYRAQYATVNYTLRNRWDSRRFQASFSYRFGSNDVKAHRNRSNTANNDVRGRTY